MTRHLEQLLAGAVANPDLPILELPVLSPGEYDQLVVTWNETATEFPRDRHIHELFEAQVDRTPDAVAVICGSHTLTYRELNQRANQLAHYLRGHGVRPETRVGVAMERSFEMVVALYGILKAGGAYVPLDPEYPSDRLGFMMSDSQLPVLLTQEHLLSQLPSDCPEQATRVLCLDRDWARVESQSVENPALVSRPDNLAYVIYTSGSTGRPKGVMNEHRGVLNGLLWMEDAFGLGPSDRVLQKTPFSFDVSVWEFFLPLMVGAQLVMARPGGHRDGAYLLRTVVNDQITTLFLVPSMLQVFLETPDVEQSGHLKRVICSGEALTRSLQDRFFQRLSGGAALHNLYGPTEAAVHVSWWRCQPNSALECVPIGKPIANTELYILDERLQPVPIGVPGELHIGGVQVARGYLNREELTTEKFIPDPFSKRPGARLFKTGDLARYLPNGAIEYLGRLDFQVKLRGLRIELGEIEATLDRHAGVGQSVVMAREDTPGNERLVAYVVAREAAPSPAGLKAHLLRTLPAYMVPSACVFLDALPVTPNGKVDRKRLPAPERSASAAAYVAPRTATEETVADIWADVLKLERVGRDEDFFEVGGHSLLAVTVVERMRRAGLNADVGTLFTTPTIAALAAGGGGDNGLVAVPPNRIPPTCEAIRPEMLPLVQLSPEEISRVVATVPGGAANVQDIYPLAPLQEGLLFHHRMASEGDSYLMTTTYGFDSRDRLEGYLEALQAVIDRNDILRTAVLWDGLSEAVQVVYRRASLGVEEVNLNATAGDVARQLRANFGPRNYRLDVRRAPLLRVFIAYDAVNGRWVMQQMVHHLLVDHVTMDIVQEEIQTYLKGHADQLPAPLPFRNFVAQSRLGVPREEHETFFRTLLGDVDEPTTPFGFSDVQGVASGIQEDFSLVDAALARRLRETARAHGVSAASVVHLAWARVLARVSGRDDVVFGTVLLGRMQGGDDAGRVLGPCINTLPIRLRVGETSVQDGIRHTHTLLAKLMRHEHASLAVAQRCSAVLPTAPLFSALLNYRHSQDVNQALAMTNHAANIEIQDIGGRELLDFEERTNYPLTLSVDDCGERFRLDAQVQSPVDPQRICAYMHTALEQLVGALESSPAAPLRSVDVLPEAERAQLLHEWNDTESAVEHPDVPLSKLDLLNDAERQRLLVDWNRTDRDYPSQLALHQLVERQVDRTPDRVAVVFENTQLTYRELDERSNRLAHRLVDMGAGPDTLVGLYAERSERCWWLFSAS